MVQVERATQAERQILTLKGVTDDEEVQRAEMEADRVKAYHRARDAELVLEGGFVFQRCGGGRRVIRRSHRGY
jgi:hypothetical protein